MKNRMRTFLVLTLLILTGGTSALGQLSTDFTYQGRLQDGGQPADGTYLLGFSLWDAASGGNQIGMTIFINDVLVTDGLFSVDLDFGAGALNGDNRWLEIEVDGNTLASRQPVNGAPYALQTRGIHVQDDGDVGVGTTNPFGRMEVTAGFGTVLRLTNVNTNGSTLGLAIEGISGAARGALVSGNSSADMFTARNDGSGSAAFFDGDVEIEDGALNISAGDLNVALGDMFVTAGDVGIGTNLPERILHTSGDAVLFERAANDAAVVLRNTLDGELNAQFGLRSTGPDEGYAYLTDETQTRRLYLRDGFVGVGRTDPVIPESHFEVEAPAGQGIFGGMFVNSSDDESFPFYGYATDDVSRCFTFYNSQVEKWFINVGGIHRMVVGQDGRVGINTVAPNYTFECNGTAGKPGGGSWDNSSDRRLKKNINDLEGSLEKMLKLRGVSFEYIDPKSINELSGERIGVIAQEVEKVFPDWVGERPDGYKTVTFRGFEAVAVEAIRELRAEKDAEVQEWIAANKALQTENDEMCQRLEEVESAVAALMGAQR